MRGLHRRFLFFSGGGGGGGLTLQQRIIPPPASTFLCFPGRTLVTWDFSGIQGTWPFLKIDMRHGDLPI